MSLMSCTMTVSVAVAVLGGSPSSTARILIWCEGEASRSRVRWMETVPSAEMLNCRRRSELRSIEYLTLMVRENNSFSLF